MKFLLTGTAVALSLALSSAAWATVPDLAWNLQQAADQAISSSARTSTRSRRTPPPSGPASQTLYCSPSTPDCP